MVEQLNDQLFEKDKKIEQLEKLLRAKQTYERELAFKNERVSEEESKGPTKMQKKPNQSKVQARPKMVEDGPTGIEYEG